jgi:NADPH-dependent curcumin reductase CurA
MQGFIVFQFENRYQEAREYLAKKLNKGELKYEWTVVGAASGKGDGSDGGKKGVEACVDGLLGLYEGKNVGKT